MRTQRTISKHREPVMDNRRFTNRRTTHPSFHQREVTPAEMGVVTAVNRIEIRKAVVKAFFVSANLSAMTAAFFS